MARYTVTQLARLSGVSVRALHHYDDIGLLKPAYVGDNRYRYYGRQELLRLQDILFHRELGVPLADIGKLLDNGSDRLAVLQHHREQLAQDIAHTSDLLRTIDRTIAELKGEEEMTDRELYHGFAPEKHGEYENWLIGRHGEPMREQIAHSRAALSKLDRDEMGAMVAEGEAAEQALAQQFRDGVASDEEAIAPLLERHRAWVASMWARECPPQAYAGLADLYLAHPDFRSRYEGYAEGFTDWLTNAMKTHGANIAI